MLADFVCTYYQGYRPWGGREILADQLTLSQPGLCPPNYYWQYWHSQIFRPSDGLAYLVFKIVETIVQFLLKPEIQFAYTVIFYRADEKLCIFKELKFANQSLLNYQSWLPGFSQWLILSISMTGHIQRIGPNMRAKINWAIFTSQYNELSCTAWGSQSKCLIRWPEPFSLFQDYVLHMHYAS